MQPRPHRRETQRLRGRAPRPTCAKRTALRRARFQGAFLRPTPFRVSLRPRPLPLDVVSLCRRLPLQDVQGRNLKALRKVQPHTRRPFRQKEIPTPTIPSPRRTTRRRHRASGLPPLASSKLRAHERQSPRVCPGHWAAWTTLDISPTQPPSPPCPHHIAHTGHRSPTCWTTPSPSRDLFRLFLERLRPCPQPISGNSEAAPLVHGLPAVHICLKDHSPIRAGRDGKHVEGLVFLGSPLMGVSGSTVWSFRRYTDCRTLVQVLPGNNVSGRGRSRSQKTDGPALYRLSKRGICCRVSRYALERPCSTSCGTRQRRA